MGDEGVEAGDKSGLSEVSDKELPIMKDSHVHEEKEAMKKVTVLLEEEQVEALKELAVEYREKLGKQWNLSAMVRVAVGDFLTRMGKMT